MLKLRQSIGTVAWFGLLLGSGEAIPTDSCANASIAATASLASPVTSPVTSVVTSTETPRISMAMPHTSPSTGEFERIEQPFGIKLGVTAVGVSLIGLELWWFLGSKPRAQKVRLSKAAASVTQPGIQELEVAVDGGYEPSRIIVQAGQPVRLNFFRKDPSSCLEQVLIPDFHIAQTLPLNQRTAIEFTPEQPGDYPFTCGMNMFRGVIQVVPEKVLANELST